MTTRGNLVPPGFPSALLTHTAAIGLGLGLLPFIFGGAWLIANARRDVFATLAVAAIVLVTAEVASYDIRFGGGLVRERYLFYIAPLFAIAFAAALQAGVRWWWLVAPTAVLAAGFALDPLPVFTKLNVDTPASIFDNYIRTQIGDLTDARLFLVCAALVACLMLIEGQVFLRRQWFIGAVVVVALFTTTASTAYAFARLFRVDGTAGRPVTSDPRPDQAWVDRAVGRGASVTAVPFPTITGDYWSSAAYWWDLQFWNESVDAVAGIPGQFEWTPSTFPKLALRFDRLGRASSSRAGYVIQAVGDTRFHLAGVVVINNRNVFLVRPRASMAGRLVGVRALQRRLDPARHGSADLRLSVSRPGGARRATPDGVGLRPCGSGLAPVLARKDDERRRAERGLAGRDGVCSHGSPCAGDAEGAWQLPDPGRHEHAGHVRAAATGRRGRIPNLPVGCRRPRLLSGPRAEDVEQGGLCLRREVVGRQRPGQLDRASKLVDVLGAAVAARDVLLEPPQIGGRQSTLEVLGDELDELLAAECFDVDHARYSSRACRTLDRARCNSTR